TRSLLHMLTAASGTGRASSAPQQQRQLHVVQRTRAARAQQAGVRLSVFSVSSFTRNGTRRRSRIAPQHDSALSHRPQFVAASRQGAWLARLDGRLERSSQSILPLRKAGLAYATEIMKQRVEDFLKLLTRMPTISILITTIADLRRFTL